MSVAIFTLFISVSYLTSISGSTSSIALQPGDWLQYSVFDSSESVNLFYGAWPPGEYYGNWSAKVGDNIFFNISSVTKTSINGTLSIGDYVFSNVRNIDVASALSLSIYPWLGGFFANASDWDNILSSITGTNTTVTLNSSYVKEINNQLFTFSVKIFNTTNYYGQYSTFYYDELTGVLLEGQTSFGSYHLGLRLVSTSLFTQQTSNTSTFPTSFSNILYLISALIPIMVLKRRQ